MWLQWLPDAAIMQHTYWPPPASIWIHHLHHLNTEGKFIQFGVITTLTQWRLEVHFGLRISPTGSVDNSSRLSLQVRVRVQTKRLPNWRFGLSINPNCQLGSGLMVNSKPVWIGWVFSGSPSGSIHIFIYGSCIWSGLIVLYQNHIFNTQWYVFACCAACIIAQFGIGVLPVRNGIFASQGGQWFR